MKRKTVRILLVAVTGFLLLFPVSAAGEGEQQFANMGDCLLESGTAIRECRVGYRTFGTLNDENTNAILFTTWFTGTSGDLQRWIGPGKLVDSSKYFVVAVDAFGNGVSSSPSNSRVQPGSSFPEFTIRDMAKTQHRLLTEILGLTQLHAALGISMGAEQIFEWLVSFPDFMRKGIPIEGSPVLTSYDRLLWEAELRILEAIRRDNLPPETAEKILSSLWSLVLHTPQFRVRETPKEEIIEFLEELERQFFQGIHPEDRAKQVRAMITHDIARPFGHSLEEAAHFVQAEVLVIVASQDQVIRPEPALKFAGLLGARTVELSSDCGHVAFICEQERVKTAVHRFLDE
jgi:homoserine O-acetyltransferase